ncbi:Rv3235 family protein [Pseudonocardia phyllosphaerae]|uniref:Rv3235 family protein n=1 Tax=Pseudonocardia phyllosphaerae TaxID=3390502 RepID=UPI00397D8BEE
MAHPAAPEATRLGPSTWCTCCGGGRPRAATTILPGGIRIRPPAHEPPPMPVWAHRPAGFPVAGPPVPTAAPPPVVDPTLPADRDRAREQAGAITRLVVEVLAGRRQPAQLTGLAPPAVVRQLAALRPAGRSTRHAGPGGRVPPPGCGAAPEIRRPARLHVAHPHPDAAEVCTTTVVGGRTRALVLRLDRAGAEASWTITQVALL